MKKVYSIAHGHIKTYELVKTTPCFFRIVNSTGNTELVSRHGQRLPVRLGGRTVETTDVLEAYTAAQKQINTIHIHIAQEREALGMAELGLAAFVLTHTVETDHE